ncbi:MAG TPA: glycosyltransferase family 1 protein [Devosia sp.]|nr:glycosyltransferase family 1 protein [Devosia sp.]
MSGQFELAIDCRMALHSGIGVVIRNVIGELVQLRPDWRLRLLGAPAEWREGRPASDNVSNVDMRSAIYSLSEQLELRRVSAGASALWSPHYNGGVLAGVPLVVTIHDVTHLVIRDYVRLPHKRLYAELMYRAVRARAAGLIFVSDFSRREFERVVGPASGETYVAHNAVDQRWFVPPANAAATLPDDYVVFVGNVKPHKNLSGLLKAMKMVREKLDVSLVLVGKLDGFITGDAEGAAEARELSQWVHVVEAASDEELRAIVGHAKALVFPSLYEGFGLPPLEAMAIGCPTIVSDAASIPEVCGDASAYFDPQSPADMARTITAVLQDPERLAGMVARGRARAAEFSWNAAAETVATAIERAAGR